MRVVTVFSLIVSSCTFFSIVPFDREEVVSFKKTISSTVQSIVDSGCSDIEKIEKIAQIEGALRQISFAKVRSETLKDIAIMVPAFCIQLIALKAWVQGLDYQQIYDSIKSIKNGLLLYESSLGLLLLSAYLVKRGQLSFLKKCADDIDLLTSQQIDLLIELCAQIRQELIDEARGCI